MKKKYEAPEMLVEAVAVEEPLALSLDIFGGEDDTTVDGKDALTKDRDDSVLGDLW